MRGQQCRGLLFFASSGSPRARTEGYFLTINSFEPGGMCWCVPYGFEWFHYGNRSARPDSLGICKRAGDKSSSLGFIGG
jgi:hypothetical protein